MFMRLFFTITVQWLVRQRHPVKCCVSHHLLARESRLSEKKGREKKIYRSWIRVGLQLCQGV